MAETAKHVAGPWVSETTVTDTMTPSDRDNGLAVIAVLPEVQRNEHDTPTRGMVAWVHSGIGACETDGQAIATARLIAAAPDLLAALKAIVLEIRSYHRSFDARLFVEAERAIAKAEGRPHPRDPDPTREGIFRDHNCSKCQSGQKPCVEGNSARCSWPVARNN